MEFAVDSFTTLHRYSEFNSVVVPVLVNDGKKLRCVGSAFNISPSGLWVTARHVIDDAIKRDRWVHIWLLWSEPAIGSLDPRRSGALIPVTHFTKDDANGSDLGLLRAGILENNVRHEFPYARLSARVPKTGTRVLAMGYANFEVSSDSTTRNIRRMAFRHGFSVSTGRVLEVYREGRDTFRDLDGRPTGMLPTACFQTSARFDPGMSGGPVMDETGFISGIVSTSLETGESFASSITPCLFTLAVFIQSPLCLHDRDGGDFDGVHTGRR